MKIAFATMSPKDRAWLEATFDRNRKRFGDLRMEAEPEPADACGEPAPAAEGDQQPEAKHFADMTDAEKVDYLTAKNRTLENRVRGKSDDPTRDVKTLQRRIKELEPLAEKVQSLEAANQTESEKALSTAKAEGEKAGREAALVEARQKYGEQLVKVRLESAAASKGMTPEALLKLAGKPDRFLGDEGVDDDELNDFLSALPDATAEKKPAAIDLGAGARTPGKVDGLTHGEDLYASRHKKSSTRTG